MLEDDIARVDNSINYTPLNSNVSNAWKRIKKKLEEIKKPSTNTEKSLIPLDVVEELILKWVGENGRREISHLLHEYVEQQQNV